MKDPYLSNEIGYYVFKDLPRARQLLSKLKSEGYELDHVALVYGDDGDDNMMLRDHDHTGINKEGIDFLTDDCKVSIHEWGTFLLEAALIECEIPVLKHLIFNKGAHPEYENLVFVNDKENASDDDHRHILEIYVQCGVDICTDDNCFDHALTMKHYASAAYILSQDKDMTTHNVMVEFLQNLAKNK